MQQRSNRNDTNRKQAQESSERSNAPSKVVYVRSVPTQATEAELSAFCSPFGVVSNVVVLSGRGQAFIEMADLNSAIALVNYYREQSAISHGQQIYFAFSDHSTIAKPDDTQKANNILLVTVANVLYPVTVDVLHQIFSRHGAVQKVVIFTKSKVFQALVQMADVTSASLAKQSLDGQNIYAGCNTLKIVFSELQSLSVKYDSDKGRDFTRPPRTVETPVAGTASASTLASSLTSLVNRPLSAPAAALGLRNAVGSLPSVSLTSLGAGLSGASNSPVLLVNGLEPNRTTPDELFTLFCLFGNVEKVKIIYTKRESALIQFTDALGAFNAKTHLHGVFLHGLPLHISFSKNTSVSMPRLNSEDENAHLTKDYTNSPLHRFRLVGSGSRNFANITAPSSVLHLSNLSSDTTEEQIRNWLESEDNQEDERIEVQAVKFIGQDSSKRMALVKVDNVNVAVAVIVAFHNQTLDGRRINVSFSKSTL
eukprot:GILI01009234.1.p1 GENE.GILI01009234.1~~GILI01009234.1.p1  ORF type:complete len:481 (-),score=116.78 GILI01009234.1:1041-2483(-)